MQRIIRPLLPALLIAAISSSAFAQSEPGSIDDLLGADFAPLQTQTATQLPEIQLPEIGPLPKIGPPLPSPTPLPAPPQLPDLNAPLIMSPQVQPPQEMYPRLDLGSEPSQSVLEVPRVTIDETAPGMLVLPDLTIPTPENTAAEPLEGQRVLRPQLDVGPQGRDLLPDNRDFAQQRVPRLQSPQALNYGSRAYSSRSRIQLPIQIEFYSASRSFGYQPYGGYGGGYRTRSSYRPYGGYAPRGYGGGYGGGRSCPYSR